ncbi:hypothetical protein CH299_07890 [Rhodococcus sp. 14-2686-1-2]|nr:hypothetical protein CH301_07340 [Rhodococcus sp. 15-1189-1-1a]OZF17045.1 hypothetical protein CH299_07890 [Rhodococcus sp. 14-2686-1-2]
MKSMKNKFGLSDAAVIVAIVVVGIVAGWVTNDPVDPASGYVAEPVEYPVDIPGCDSVEPPEEGVSYGIGFSGPLGYDHPDYPWLTSEKANAMSRAAQEAVPDDVVIVSGSRGPFYGKPFVFQPVPGVTDEYDAGTSADATVLRGDVEGEVHVNITRSFDGPEPCRAGWLDARETLIGGTVVDTQNTWMQWDGVRSYSNIVRVYAPDGTNVVASSSGSDGIPLSLDELRYLALDPELLWSGVV